MSVKQKELLYRKCFFEMLNLSYFYVKQVLIKPKQVKNNKNVTFNFCYLLTVKIHSHCNSSFKKNKTLVGKTSLHGLLLCF